MQKRRILTLTLAGLLALPALSNTVQAASTYKLESNTPGFYTASDAVRNVNRRVTYGPGTYYIYKTHGEAINITRKQGVPGAWIKKVTPAKVTPKPAPANNSKPSTPAKPVEQAKDTYKVTSTVKGYNNAFDAMSGRNAKWTYSPGTYHIFRTYKNGAINITRTKGIPGIWINPSEKAVTPSKPAPAKPSTPTQNKTTWKSLNGTSTKVHGWSWGYPSSEGKRILRENNGVYMQGNEVYITFDNGYEYQNLSAKILDTLKAKNVKAVFFTTGAYMNENPALTKRMIAEGHIVANHTNKHLSPNDVSPERIEQDIKEWETIYKRVVGSEPKVKLYRPPYGHISERTVRMANNLGYKTVMWGLAYEDWVTDDQPSENWALNHISKNTEKGDIVLLHSVSRTNANILGRYIDWLRNNNFTIGEFK